jgi:hypothetical protein
LCENQAVTVVALTSGLPERLAGHYRVLGRGGRLPQRPRWSADCSRSRRAWTI